MADTYVPAALGRLVDERAGGRCEYCLIPAMAVFSPHEIDHIISLKHGGPTAAGNLALSCTLCNKYKGSDISSQDPETSEICPLYHPRRDRWSDHFRISAAQLVPLTSTGRVTARLLQFNHPDRIEEREIFIATGLFHLPDP